ncbi:glycerophosphodiester phosphodiesterase family protein [uncultured Vibrio sp.]|uniref:glycerophosphodiester phosphodiesterase family protein n=1 Tax=uncultured Vibrio sp. TaxID=114054 RepID=UPI0025E33AB6|nr:glycerophosphodiester phosphodiesterase family protein [uncultured Vibrio sp.]
MMKSLIASHRGGTLLWGENSRRAFENTLNLPVELVEFDVHPTKDGVLVVHHDATLDRTTNMTGPVNDLTWQELSQGSVNYSGGQRIMTLKELCELYRNSDIQLRLEIKGDTNKVPYPNIVAQVLSELEETGMKEKCVISSFNCEVLAEVASKAPEMFTIWLVARNMPSLLGAEKVAQIAIDTKVNEVSVHVSQIMEETQQAVKTSHLEYGCYGAHNEADIKKALALGMYAFTTDRPDLALLLRNQFMLRTQ